jgi:hypothetical protein
MEWRVAILFAAENEMLGKSTPHHTLSCKRLSVVSLIENE